jgi:hypothetical protein
VSGTGPTRPKNWSPKLSERRALWQDADAEAEVIKPLTKSEAQRIDDAIRTCVGEIEHYWYTLNQLVAEAKQGQIHVTLGYKSWTAYLADVVKIKPDNRSERRELVLMLNRAGLSQRAIAPMVGVDQKTVSNDRATEENSSVESNVIGLDGKRRPRQPKPEPAKRQPLSSDLHGITSRITAATSELEKLPPRIDKLRADDRYSRYRKEYEEEIVKRLVAHVNRINRWIMPKLERGDRDRIVTALAVAYDDDGDA